MMKQRNISWSGQFFRNFKQKNRWCGCELQRSSVQPTVSGPWPLLARYTSQITAGIAHGKRQGDRRENLQDERNGRQKGSEPIITKRPKEGGNNLQMHQDPYFKNLNSKEHIEEVQIRNSTQDLIPSMKDVNNWYVRCVAPQETIRSWSFAAKSVFLWNYFCFCIIFLVSIENIPVGCVPRACQPYILVVQVGHG